MVQRIAHVLGDCFACTGPGRGLHATNGLATTRTSRTYQTDTVQYPIVTYTIRYSYRTITVSYHRTRLVLVPYHKSTSQRHIMLTCNPSLLVTLATNGPGLASCAAQRGMPSDQHLCCLKIGK
eukprot:scaffold16269_cov16-Prasinocladus_malaysianus.AAC.1